MVGQNVYTSEEIKFLLQRFIEGKDGSQIAEEYYEAFEKVLTPNQLRYVRNKYGKDPKYNTAMINTNMGKKRRRADDGSDRQNPSSSPDPKPKKQRKESEPKFQLTNKKSTEAIKSSPEPDNKGSRSSEQARQSQQAHINRPITLQAPVATYQQLPASETFIEMAQTLMSPVAAPVANTASYQQPGSISVDYNQIQTLWDNEGQNLGSFSDLGNIVNLPTLQPSPATPSLGLTTLGGQHRPFVNNTTRLVQTNIPLASPYHVISSPQPTNPQGQRIPAQPMPQYMMNQQSIDGMAAMGQFSPLNLPLPAAPHYSADLQESPHSDIQSPSCGSLSNAQPILPFGNQDWGSYLSSGLYNLPQQQRPDINLSHFQPIPQPVPAETETFITAAIADSSDIINVKNKDAPAEVLPKVAPTTEATPIENTTATALHVVSNQVSGADEAQIEYHGVSLTSDFDACQTSFLSDAGADANPETDSDQIRDLITTLFPHLEQVENLDKHEIPDTIDPKLLSDTYTQPALKRRTSNSPSEGGRETAGDLAESG